MIKAIIEFVKDIPNVIVRAVKDIFLLIADGLLWIKELIFGLFKLVFKLVENIPTFFKKIIEISIKMWAGMLKIPGILLKIAKQLFIIIKKLPKIFWSIIKGIGRLILKIFSLLIVLVKKVIGIIPKIPFVIVKIIKTILWTVPVGIITKIIGLGKKIGFLFTPKTKNQKIFLGFIILGAVIGGLGTFLNMERFKFEVPPLVEGANTVFFIPIPEALKNFIWAVNLETINPENVGFLFTNKGYGLPVSLTVVSTWFVMAIIFIVFWTGTRNLQVVPGKFQAVLESLYGAFDTLIGQTMNSWKKKYFSYISALLLFIASCNIIGFFPIPKITGWGTGTLNISPALRSPTADLNTTVGLAILTTIIFTAIQLKVSGIRDYVKGFFSPIFAMAPLNVIGEIAKPVNISLRLFGNAFAGSVIIGLLYMATTSYGPLAAVVAPLHLYFDLFGGVVQGFVFTMLSMVYISGAYGDEEYIEDVEIPE